MDEKKVDVSKIKILVCCHKPCELPKDDIFLPIQVGAAISDLDLGIQRDDQVNGETCDNISAKNKSYCELTAMYWAWKNIKKLYPDLEYIGLNHYRRYFSFSRRNLFDDAIIRPENSVSTYKIDTKKLTGILTNYNAIISSRRTYSYNLDTDYCVGHMSEDLRILKRIVHKCSPEYDMDMLSVLTCNNRLAHYNMTVIGWKEFDSYCTWLFQILFECERTIDISHYSPVQKRIWGYMAERLFNVWIHHKRLGVKYLNVLKYSNEKKQNPFFALRHFFKVRFEWMCMRPKNIKHIINHYKEKYWS